MQINLVEKEIGCIKGKIFPQASLISDISRVQYSEMKIKSCHCTMLTVFIWRNDFRFIAR